MDAQKSNPEIDVPTVEQGTSCSVCFEDMTPEIFVVYKVTQNNDWVPFTYCNECLTYIMESQWETYVSGLRKADCEATLRKLIEVGPPSHFRDPRIENGAELFQFMCNSNVISGKLRNSLDGEVLSQFDAKLKDILPLLNGKHNPKKNNDNSNNNDNDSVETLDYMAHINRVLNEFNL